MSTTLEGIVRPFSAPEVFTARRTVQVEAKPPVQAAILTWGKPIDAKFLRPDTVFELKDVTEKSRVTRVERVENPNDPTQFVDVERIISMVMTNDKTGEEQNWKFNND